MLLLYNGWEIWIEKEKQNKNVGSMLSWLILWFISQRKYLFLFRIVYVQSWICCTQITIQDSIIVSISRKYNNNCKKSPERIFHVVWVKLRIVLVQKWQWLKCQCMRVVIDNSEAAKVSSLENDRFSTLVAEGWALITVCGDKGNSPMVQRLSSVLENRILGNSVM